MVSLTREVKLDVEEIQESCDSDQVSDLWELRDG